MNADMGLHTEISLMTFWSGVSQRHAFRTCYWWR